MKSNSMEKNDYKRNFLIIPGVHRNSDRHMLYFMEKAKSSARTAEAEGEWEGCDFLCWDLTRTNAALMRRARGYAGPSSQCKLNCSSTSARII